MNAVQRCTEAEKEKDGLRRVRQPQAVGRYYDCQSEGGTGVCLSWGDALTRLRVHDDETIPRLL